MLIHSLAVDSTVDARIQTLRGLRFVQVTKVSSFERMPEIVPLDNQIHFFKDGIEAIVGKTQVGEKEKYNAMLVDQTRKLIVEYSFLGKDYREE